MALAVHLSHVSNLNVAAKAFCQGLDIPEQHIVQPVLTFKRIEADQPLFWEEEPAVSIYKVASGVLRLSKLLPDGRRQIVGFAYHGQFLGVTSAGRYIHSAEAVGDVTLYCYPRAQLDRLVEQFPGVRRRLLAMTASELRSAQDQMLLLGRKDARERVASFLLLTAAIAPRAVNGLMEIDLPMSRNDIADYLGLTTETVSRTLSGFKAAGMIALPTPCRLIVLRPDEIRHLAGYDDGDDSAEAGARRRVRAA